ncbi:Hopanoid C-3 methylase [Halioglobus japonicus]|nr:Hopanoid C-3 methylase [Halioglobus japonicus]
MDKNTELPLTPTTKCIVKLGEQGVHLHSPYGASVYKLQFHELVALFELQYGGYTDMAEVAAIVATKTGTPKASTVEFIKSLIRRGRVRRREHRVPLARLRPPKTPAGSSLPDFDKGLVALKIPQTLRIGEGKFQLVDHDGHLIVGLTAAELIAVGEFVRPTALSEGLERQRSLLKGHALEKDRLLEVLSKLYAAGLLSIAEPTVVSAKETLGYRQTLKANIARQAAELDKKESLRQQQTGVYRTKVIPVAFGDSVPAALGLIMAYSKAYNGGCLEEFYDFRLDWIWDEERTAGFTAKPAIYLFSNYLWTHGNSIAVSETVKRLSPDSITIHGGPDTPKYAQDAEDYFAKFPHVDIIIRGEGEATCADTLDKLRSVVGQHNPDLSVLEGVAGITYRYRGEIIRNPDRERIADLDTIPSPYLTGLFEAFRGVPQIHVTLETNRGCPYGCTFCDWGSATTSKIRKFDLDRVFGELEWCSDMKVVSVSQCDANFGIFERDVEIAERVAELKGTTGFPQTFGGSYAKNSTKYLQKIIKVLADAGILAQGVLSLQTMDDSTLSVINRSNIKVAKYDALANEMRNSNLQLSVELMMGLPGATLESFIEDLQQCIDREIPARVNHTTMLVNSPMNSPDYREEHQIKTGTELGPGKMPVLVSTRTYTRDDLATMIALKNIYLVLDTFGVMRLCSRFVRQQVGMTEMEFYRLLLTKTGSGGRERVWPMLNTLVNYGHDLMAPAYSWALVFKELRNFLIKKCEVQDDTALQSILAAQHALLPAHGRVFPHVVELPHDVVAWHAQMLSVKGEGHWKDWQSIVPPLSSFGPGRLEVNDVNGSVTKLLGCDIEISSGGGNWDMVSGIARARVDMQHVASGLSGDIIHVA